MWDMDKNIIFITELRVYESFLAHLGALLTQFCVILLISI